VLYNILYISISAYATTYGDNPVWKEYRRNFKGGFQPLKTRKSCIVSIFVNKLLIKLDFYGYFFRETTKCRPGIRVPSAETSILCSTTATSNSSSSSSVHTQERFFPTRKLKVPKNPAKFHKPLFVIYRKTGVCQKKHRQLLVAVENARDCGYLTYDVPHRVYDYSEYIKQ